MPLDAYPPSPTATPPTWATPPALHNFFQPPQLGPFWEFSTPPAKVGGLQAMLNQILIGTIVEQTPPPPYPKQSHQDKLY